MSDLISNEHDILSPDDIQSQRLIAVLAADDFALVSVTHNDVGVLIEGQQLADQLATVTQKDQNTLAEKVDQRGGHDVGQEGIGLRG